MLCLGIETSCDDTSLALVEDSVLLGQESVSQAGMHALFGGVVPELASREHVRFIGPLCDRLLRRACVAAGDIDLVCPARGPGLLGSLLVGISFAKAFALGSGARFLGVNHLHAHIFAAGLERELPLPALALLVSGGHSMLYRAEAPDNFALLGKSIDDAAGEAFDKAGKMLGLPYPAGSAMDALAEEGCASPRLFPRPYSDNESLDFSFSGLKTAMWLYISEHPECRVSFDAASGEAVIPQGEKRAAMADVCASYRLAVVDSLCVKVERAIERGGAAGARSLILAGGVAANSLLQRRMGDIADRAGLPLCVPSLKLCADNGAMIAYLGVLLAGAGYVHNLDMEAVPRGKPIPDDMIRVSTPPG
ncbi:MAG: tRNA (adenosine(37)-N6)-threonylcarbamoyltransferase complex transferase subunit TsaD [Desulfovibrio sp.]|jgi:N6-L-threonylcarbamoyladenine synthase|nr:tRNA (adenosine(37)-N6)-threonylcarbamoyltransferase complex transferase subunit TsaD [Desulfovibrio sp.]